MRYSQIRKLDISNGEGIGISLFVQGCHFHCKNCFNHETWDFNSGKEWTEEVQCSFLNLINKPFVKRVSILGGEPLTDENIEDVLKLIKTIKSDFYLVKIWLYSGFTYEECLKTPLKQAILEHIDVLVDGCYDDNKRDISLHWRGSSNQRVINVKESIKQDKVVLYDTY